MLTAGIVSLTIFFAKKKPHGGERGGGWEMIYLDLLLGFLKVGCFAFGGAYGAIPLIRDVVLSYGWMSEESLTYLIAVSESTPGPIMVNLATFVGSSQAGFLGAAAATAAVVTPSANCLLCVYGNDSGQTHECMNGVY